MRDLSTVKRSYGKDIQWIIKVAENYINGVFAAEKWC